MVIENWKDENDEYHTRPYIKVDDIEIAKFKEEKKDSEEGTKANKNSKYSKYRK